jgi:hypothetical protein
MSYGLLLIIMVLVIIALSVTSSKKLENQIFITMRTAHDRREEFLVNKKGRFFFFQGFRYDIIPSCCKPMTWKRGVHMFIPTTVQAADYTWSNTTPIDPDTGLYYVVSPEAQGAMDDEENFTAMNRSTKKEMGKKEVGMNKYLPYIAIGLVLLVAAYLYMQIKGVDNSITVLGEMFKAHIGSK